MVPCVRREAERVLVVSRRITQSPIFLRWATFAVFLITIWSVALLKSDISAPYITANDMTPDYVSARAWLHGIEPYATIRELNDRFLGPSAPYFIDFPGNERNPHPPVAVLLFAPFALLSITAARVLWLGLMLGAVAWAMIRFTRELGWSKRGQFVAGALTLSIPAVRSDFAFAQANSLLLLVLVYSWIALRRGHDARAGVLLGLISAFRVFPILFVIPLLRLRRMRSVAWMLITTVVLSLFGVIAIGVHSTGLFVGTASTNNTKFWISQPANLSLVGLPFRWLTKNHWMAASVSLPWIALGLGIVLMLLCLTAMYRTPARVSGDVFWASTPWILLATPLSWFHYAVILLPLLILLERGTRRAGLLRVLVLIACGGTIIARVVADRFIAHGLGGYSPFVQVAGYSIAMYGFVGIGLAEWAKQSLTQWPGKWSHQATSIPVELPLQRRTPRTVVGT